MNLSPSQRIAIPEGAYFSTAWLPNGWLVAEYEATRRFEYRPWRLRPDGSEFERISLPDQPGCSKTLYQNATTLPDGRLGLVAGCEPLDVGGQASFNIVAYDVETKTVENLLSNPILYNPTQFSWNPELTRAVFGHSSGICGSIAWLTRQGLEEADITIADNGKSWRLDAFFERGRGEPCTDEGRADSPAWSPDGHNIAFFASPQSIGVEGQARLDEPWNLYLMTPGETTVRPLLRDLKEPASPVWSPDGGSLAFTADVPGQGKGLYVLEPDSRRPRRVLNHYLGGLDWAPDGTRLVGVRQLSKPGEWPPRSELLVVDVKQPGRPQTSGRGNGIRKAGVRKVVPDPGPQSIAWAGPRVPTATRQSDR